MIMKTINEQQIQAIMQLLQKYNVGVNDYVAVEKMLKELPTNEVKSEPTA